MNSTAIYLHLGGVSISSVTFVTSPHRVHRKSTNLPNPIYARWPLFSSDRVRSASRLVMVRVHGLETECSIKYVPCSGHLPNFLTTVSWPSLRNQSESLCSASRSFL
jgi:hypothetical protein